MQIIKNWEKNSTVRNRPRRILINNGSKYFFPITEQPLCLHPLIDSMGEEVKHYILVQSAYVFMQNIFVNETDVVCDIARKIIQGRTQISFPEEIYQNLLTVIIDETYHAYVANDFVHQVSNMTRIKPIGFSEESSLTRALNLIRNTLPPHCRFFFEIIAVCIAENSITKELIVTIKDPEVNPFFNEINADHLADEGRHCGIFLELLTYLWKEMTDDIKKIVGSSLPNFIFEYLSREIKIKIDRKILSQLPLMHDEIETILYDTHPNYTVETLRLMNPIVDNVVGLLQKAGIFSHPDVAMSFQRLGYAENTNIMQNTHIQQAEKHWQWILEHLNSWQIDFLRSIEYSSLPEQQLHSSVLLNADITPNICCGFVISYLHDLIQNEQISFRLIANISNNKMISVPVLSTFADVVPFTDFVRQIDIDIANSIAFSSFFEKIVSQNGFLNEGGNWFYKIPLCVTLSENFVLEQNYPEILRLHIFPSDRNTLQMSVYYNSKYYDSRRIDEFLENFSYYLTSALNNPSYHRKNVPLVSPQQREFLLKHASVAHIDNTQNETVITLFAKQVAENPMQPAIIDESIAITYQELDCLSDMIAHKLQSLGFKSGAIIAVIHENSNAYIPIILGIMKAKMVFLPLSPNEANTRLHAILQEAQVDLVISNLEQLACGQGEYSWILSSKLMEPSSIKIDNKQSKLTSDDLAYIIYTSGSSGTPKGVMITHQSLGHFARSAAKTFPITKHDRILQFCAYNFDASLADICVSLISGATICLRTKNLLDSSSCFFAVCQRYKITLLNLPATLWGQLVQDIFAFSIELPDSLKTVMIGGEALAPAILEQWFQHKRSDIRLLNTYGPTETTIAVTACELTTDALFYSREKLIGKSFTHAMLYVLDPYYRLLPVGASGELYIGGPGVGRGYFKRPDLTEKSFLNNLNQMNADLPNSGTFYKTGDKVRWANKETLEFMGRVDRQIKIRGFRVELVEIEHALNAHPLVVSSFVIYHNKTHNPYLVAFVIPKCLSLKNFDKVTKITSELNDTMASIKSYLQLHLPEHMQVTRIQFVEKWPMTTQGKIDTTQLITLLSTDKKHYQSKDDIDSRLATFWKDLLGVQDINADSHFFYLGGHSLLAMHLFAHISREFQIQLTLRDILETPNFSNMVALIKQRFGKKNSVTQVQSGSVSGPLSFAQEGLWVIDCLHSGSSINYNIAFALHLKGMIDPIILEKALNHVIQRQWILRSVFKKENQAIQQAVAQMTITLKSEFVTLDKFKEEALADARTPFDLLSKPPLRLRLFQINSEYCILFVNHHHIIHDGYSIGIFVKELSHCYEVFCACKLPRLPELSRQYTDYAQWQRSTGNAYSTRSLDYWHQQLKDYKPLCLPFRKPNANMNASSGNTYHFLMDQTLTQSLRNLCSNHDCTLFVGLLAIMTLLFHRYSGEKDIAFASIMSTRDHQIDEHLIGMFLNVVILRNKVNPENSFFDLLARVKKTLFEATNHRYTPLELISKSMNLQRLPFCHTLVDICVSYHHFDQNFAKFESKTVHSEVEFIDNKTAKFGFSFDIYDNKKSLLIKIEYCTEFYNISSIKKFAQDYLILTKSVINV